MALPHKVLKTFKDGDSATSLSNTLPNCTTILLMSKLNFPHTGMWLLPRVWAVWHYREESGSVVFVTTLQIAIACPLLTLQPPLCQLKQALHSQPFLFWKSKCFSPAEVMWLLGFAGPGWDFRVFETQEMTLPFLDLNLKKSERRSSFFPMHF